jgi:uncharacterized protein YbbC (DUF1343 family)
MLKKLFLLVVIIPVYAYRLGVENISPELVKQMQLLSVGLIVNQTSLDRQGHRTIDILLEKGAQVRAIYTCEHGFEGKISAEKDVVSSKDTASGLSVVSLYAHGASSIVPGIFDAVDMLVFDIQDVGMRHYTYISTLYTVMQECARLKKPVVVLDRPNLLGAIMEGPICEPQLRSFISISSIPLRHGMTIGELAQLFNVTCLATKVDLSVVALSDYKREDPVSSLFAQLSPNIASVPSARGYSFLGLLGEVRPFHVGVGSQDAFRLVMLPSDSAVSSQAWQKLRVTFEQLGIRSKHYSCFHERKKKDFNGLKLFFDDMNEISGFKAFMAVLDWSKEHAVNIDFSPAFDKCVGTTLIRSCYQGRADISSEHILQSTKQQVEDFLNMHKDVLLYQPFPKVVLNKSYAQIFG